MAVNFSLLVWGGFAVVLAWAVGAYSRLNRLRDQMVRSRSSMLKYAGMYRGLCNENPIQQGDNSGADSGSQLLSALHRAVEMLQKPLADWEKDTRNQQAAQAFGKALDAVQAGIETLVTVPEDLAGARWPQEERTRWIELAADVRIRRSRYNVQVGELREAAEQMPAALMARVTGTLPWMEV